MVLVDRGGRLFRVWIWIGWRFSFSCCWVIETMTKGRDRVMIGDSVRGELSPWRSPPRYDWDRISRSAHIGVELRLKRFLVDKSPPWRAHGPF